MRIEALDFCQIIHCRPACASLVVLAAGPVLSGVPGGLVGMIRDGMLNGVQCMHSFSYTW